MFDYLYKASSAIQLIEEAKRMITNRCSKDQKELLEKQDFVVIIGSALGGLDQRQIEYFRELITSFEEDNQDEARRVFSLFLF